MGLINHISIYNTDVKFCITLNTIKAEVSDMNVTVENFKKSRNMELIVWKLQKMQFIGFESHKSVLCLSGKN